MSEFRNASWQAPPAEGEVRRLLELARGGDSTEIATLRSAMNDYPETWRHFGDLAAHARGAWIGLISGTDLAVKESVERQVEAMRTELAGPDPSAVEDLLIERVLACWLQAQHADAAVAQAGDISLKQADFARKRQDSASKRYLMAIGALTMTRRLLGSAAGTERANRRPRSKPASGKGGEDGRDVDASEADALRAFRRPGVEVDLVER